MMIFNRSSLGARAVMFGIVMLTGVGLHMAQAQIAEREVSVTSAESTQVSDLPLALTRDGWHEWTVDAVEGARNWCCFNWQNDNAVNGSCALDGNQSHGITKHTEEGFVREIRIFARLDRGQVVTVRTLGSSCNVTSKSPVTDHGKVSPAVSLNWLGQHMDSSQKLARETLMSVAAHDSSQAQDMLVNASRANKPLETRKQAVFWMGQVRARQSLDVLTSIMTKDKSDQIREHVVFSVSQSVLPDRLDLIERVARDDVDPHVRGQAWFWLAQTQEAEAGTRIQAGMQSESSLSVLKQAVFALSQLPDEQAVNALIRVAESPAYQRSVRKQALFWLAQSSSGSALDYLADVLDR